MYRDALVECAWLCSELGAGSAKVVAIAVNRVRRARVVFEAIERRIAKRGERADAALLTGRARPIDRDQILQRFRDRIRAGTARRAEDVPLFVVATQCIEAGADLDFDALVTEIAPLDCLRQRFGRLNRMGRDIQVRSFVVAASEQVGSRAEDPIYGKSLARTWALLQGKARRTGKDKTPVVDFGVQDSRAWLPDGDELASCIAPHRDAPVLLPAYIEQWACTSPIPAVDPDVALFLHGPNARSGDVEIVWRADALPPPSDPEIEHASQPGASPAGDPTSDRDDRARKQQIERQMWIERLSACPPSTLESLSVPISEAIRWLAGEARGDMTDTEVSEFEELQHKPRPAFRWRGAESDDTQFVPARALRPGDLIVVPSGTGGCDQWGWNPESSRSVRDVGREANLQHHGRDVLRLSPRVIEAELTSEIDATEDPTERRKRAARIRERVAALEHDLHGLRDATDRELCAAIAAFRGMPRSFEDLGGGAVNGIPSSSAVRTAIRLRSCMNR